MLFFFCFLYKQNKKLLVVRGDYSSLQCILKRNSEIVKEN